MMVQMQHEYPLLSDKDPSSPVRSERRFVGQTGAIRHLVGSITYHLKTVLPGQPLLYSDAELVIAEVLNNVEEHGYQGNLGMPVQVMTRLLDDVVIFETSDIGLPMPGLSVPLINRPETDVPQEALPEGGFGWYLIHSLAPNPIYRRRGNTNVLTFFLPFQPEMA